MTELLTVHSRSTRKAIWSWLGLGILVSLGTALLIFLATEGRVRLAFTLIVLSILLGLARINVHVAILGCFAFLTVLGDFRRWLLPFEDWSSADPLLLVGPLVAIVLWVVAITSDRIKLDTPLSKWMLLLMSFLAAHIFNPLQGGLMVGVAGAVFMLVPLLWYWVGKSFGSEAFMEVFFFKLVAPLACIAALFGLYQIFYGYPEYQLAWWRPRAAELSFLGSREDMLRPLAFFPNIAEYTHYLGVAVLAMVALLLRKRSVPIALLVLALVFTALFLSGTRGPVVKVIFASAVLWTILGRSRAVWVPRLAIALVVGLFGLTYGLSQVAQMEGEGRAHFNAQRQANLMPTDGGGGTISIHLNLIRIGFVRTAQQPLGRGTGYTTMAAGRFGEGGFSTEKDFTDMFISLGVPGGIVYLIILFYAAWLATKYWTRSRSTVALIIIGLLILMAMGWLRAGAYVMTPMVWFCVGAMDRMQAEASVAE
jgi:hypothetical protein